VFCFSGDGGFGFHAMELDTALRHNLPIIYLVGNDAALGVDKFYSMEYFGRAYAVDLLPTRYDQVAEALGCHGEYPQSPEELAPAIERALASGKPAVINVPITRFVNPGARGRSEGLAFGMRKRLNRHSQEA
jgi:acetolactate synthase-1/2/3 large subunit